jgi:VanZ family protein
LKPILLAIGYMLLILGLSSIPDYGKQTSFNFLYWISPTWQNLLHIPAFGLLAFLWMRVFEKKGASFWKAGLWTVLISVSYGFLNELYQLLIPGRYASAGDLVFDTVGVLSGVMTYTFVRKVQSMTCL